MSLENANFCYALVGLILVAALATVLTSRLLWAAGALLLLWITTLWALS